jgi:hypothetical protein
MYIYISINMIADINAHLYMYYVTTNIFTCLNNPFNSIVNIDYTHIIHRINVSTLTKGVMLTTGLQNFIFNVCTPSRALTSTIDIEKQSDRSKLYTLLNVSKLRTQLQPHSFNVCTPPRALTSTISQ